MKRRRALDADPRTGQRRWTSQVFTYASYHDAELGYAVTDHTARYDQIHAERAGDPAPATPPASPDQARQWVLTTGDKAWFCALTGLVVIVISGHGRVPLERGGP